MSRSFRGFRGPRVGREAVESMVGREVRRRGSGPGVGVGGNKHQ